jgi:hypothetical protein
VADANHKGSTLKTMKDCIYKAPTTDYNMARDVNPDLGAENGGALICHQAHAGLHRGQEDLLAVSADFRNTYSDGVYCHTLVKWLIWNSDL